MSTRATSYQSTQRWRNRVNFCADERRLRFVVSRRVGKLERKTSVRYGSRSIDEARRIARAIAYRLQACPSHKLAEFKF